MTAVAALAYFDARPVPPDSAQRMTRCLERYAPDGIGSVTAAGISVTRALLRITPEDRLDRQPLTHDASGTLMIADLRIDNREALAKDLDWTAEFARSASDAEFALAAYLRWGQGFHDRLLGAFALVVWNSTQRRLMAIRDPMGERDLFWGGTRDGGAAVASCPAALLAAGVSDELNRAKFVDALAVLPVDPVSTYHRHVSRLPPGHCLEATASGFQVSRYYRPETLAPRSRVSDEDALASATELLEDAVKVRLRSERRVGVMMSGGLDSPAVAAVAASQLAARGARLPTYTSIPRPQTPSPSASRLTDEAPLVRAIAAMYPTLDPFFVAPPLGTLFDDAGGFAALTGAPQLHSFNHQWISHIARDAREHGVGVLLTGQAGNLTLSWHGRPRRTALLRSLVAGTLAQARAVLGVEDPRWLRETALKADVIREFRITRRARSNGLRLGRPSTDGRPERIRTWRRVRANHGASFWGPQFGLEVRDPTGDRRVFELCLTLPTNQFARGADHRLLIRRMMRGRLPDEVLDNPRRGLQSADWLEQLRAVAARLPDDLDRIERTPWLSSLVDVDRLRGWVSSGLLARPVPSTLENPAVYHVALPRVIAVAAMAAFPKG